MKTTWRLQGSKNPRKWSFTAQPRAGGTVPLRCRPPEPLPQPAPSPALLLLLPA